MEQHPAQALSEEIFRNFWQPADEREAEEWVSRKDKEEHLLQLAVTTYNGLLGWGAWFAQDLDDFWFTHIIFDLDVERPGVQDAIIEFARRLAVATIAAGRLTGPSMQEHRAQGNSEGEGEQREERSAQ